jgi:hypothetical protein
MRGGWSTLPGGRKYALCVSPPEAAPFPKRELEELRALLPRFAPKRKLTSTRRLDAKIGLPQNIGSRATIPCRDGSAVEIAVSYRGGPHDVRVALIVHPELEQIPIELDNEAAYELITELTAVRREIAGRSLREADELDDAPHDQAHPGRRDDPGEDERRDDGDV